MNAALAEIAELVRRESGVVLHGAQFGSLRSSIARAEAGADPAAFLRLVRDPVAGAAALARLIDEVTVNETYFFREWRPLEVVSWRLLLAHAHARGESHVRVWSTACSTGEEAYSLAIAACEAFAPDEAPVRILATDISTHVLARAWEGRYRARAVKNVGPHLRARYFHDDGDDVVEVGERPRRLVEFKQHNLSRDPIPPLGERPFDLVVCRNVLIYFDHETVERVIVGLEQAFHPEGMLILGAADTLCGTTRRLARLADAWPLSRGRRRSVEEPRRPLGRERERTLADALRAASEGRREHALAETEALLAAQPLDADALFVHGLLLLEAGSAAPAAEALRRALYVDPTFGLAAFQLGRAYDELGDTNAARRSYGQALRTLEPEDDRHEVLLGQVDLGDVATAIRARLEAER